MALTADNVYVFVDGKVHVDDKAIQRQLPAPVVPRRCGPAFTALVNQQAAQLGQPPVGFLNPAIYSLCRGTNYAAIFHDITSGNNTNSSSPTNFYAAPGYDLCTGWGTPAGTNLINALTTPDPLGILPQNVFSTSGLVGGPFPQTNWLLTLTNSGSGQSRLVAGRRAGVADGLGSQRHAGGQRLHESQSCNGSIQTACRPAAIAPP